MRLLPARPTVYRGIRMRSRLEADFARWLDEPGRGVLHGGAWEYEPECFADERGQYLPDFRIVGGAMPLPQYVEVKPLQRFDQDDAAAFVDATLRQMETVWSSEPHASLILVFWEYGATEPALVWYGWSSDRRWTALLENRWVPWTGRPA